MNDFFAMGGYASFVWPSYGLGFLILVAHIAVPASRRRRVLKEIQRRLRREARAADKVSAGSE